MKKLLWTWRFKQQGDKNIFRVFLTVINKRTINTITVYITSLSVKSSLLHVSTLSCHRQTVSVAYRGGDGGGCFKTPPPPEIPKVFQNRTKFNPIVKTVKNCWIRTPKPKDVRKKGSKILKLPPVRNCFTLAMTNKLVVFINSLKVPKIKKILLYEMKFLVPNYSCLQNPWLKGYRPQIPVLSILCPQLNLLNPPPEQNSWVRHRTVYSQCHAKLHTFCTLQLLEIHFITSRFCTTTLRKFVVLFTEFIVDKTKNVVLYPVKQLNHISLQ